MCRVTTATLGPSSLSARAAHPLRKGAKGRMLSWHNSQLKTFSSYQCLRSEPDLGRGRLRFMRSLLYPALLAIGYQFWTLSSLEYSALHAEGLRFPIEN